MNELTCLEAALGLWFVHLFCQMGTAGGAISARPICLVRATHRKAPKKRGIWGRASRAFANYVENLVAFAALDLGLIVTHRSAGFAQTVWVLARVIYLPLYLFNVIYARTVAAGVAMISLLVMLWGLAAGR